MVIVRTRSLWWAALAGPVWACSSHPTPVVTAAPTPSRRHTPPESTIVAAPSPPSAPAGLPEIQLADNRTPADTEAAADSVILERLANAHPASIDSAADTTEPESTPGGANLTDSRVTWDIDVTTYGSHSRVQFYLDFFQGPARDRFTVWLQRMPRYEGMIRRKLHEYGLPEDMVYLALIESGFSNVAVSRSRAAGMWQFIKGTARLYGLRVDSWVDERRDPFRATDAAARHLSDLKDQFGSLYLAAAAYNAGAGKVDRGLRRLTRADHHLAKGEEEEEESDDASFFRLYDTRYLRRETKDYVPKLIAAALIAKQPERFGFPPVDDTTSLATDSIIVPDATGLDVIARLADTSVSFIRELNPQYLRGVTPPHASATVRLPEGSGQPVAAAYAALPPGERVATIEHVVGRGQTVGSIARMYNVSPEVIGDANPGIPMTRLKPGSRLLIPTSYLALSTRDRRSVEDRRPRVVSTVTGPGRYRVTWGESLWTIANKFGVRVTQLRSWNGIDPGEQLKAGDMIWVKPPSDQPPAPVSAAPDPPAPRATPPAAQPGRTHLVRRGETLSQIATHYGVTLQALRQANDLQARELLKTGTRLKIPGS
jgi:membrane-bound lytic murein transglycosylase D